MTKVAVILANGFEEIEALTPVDVFRRAGFDCDMIGLTDVQVTGSHAIPVRADLIFSGDLSAYDLVVLPGGMPGSQHLREHEGLLEALRQVHKAGKWVAAICAAPTVLFRAGLLENRNFTCFPGIESQITVGNHLSDLVVEDDKIVTSRGAGTSLAFAYYLVDVLGGDATALSKAMVYDQLFE